MYKPVTTIRAFRTKILARWDDKLVTGLIRSRIAVMNQTIQEYKGFKKRIPLGIGQIIKRIVYQAH